MHNNISTNQEQRAKLSRCALLIRRLACRYVDAPKMFPAKCIHERHPFGISLLLTFEYAVPIFAQSNGGE